MDSGRPLQPSRAHGRRCTSSLLHDQRDSSADSCVLIIDSRIIRVVASFVRSRGWVRPARGRGRRGPTRSHPEPDRETRQRRRVLWFQRHGRRGHRGRTAPFSLGSTILATVNSPQVSRGGAAAARRAHNPKVGGSNPPPATSEGPVQEPLYRAFLCPSAIGFRAFPR